MAVPGSRITTAGDLLPGARFPQESLSYLLRALTRTLNSDNISRILSLATILDAFILPWSRTEMWQPLLSRRQALLGGASLAFAANVSGAHATPVATPAAAFPRTISHVLGDTVVPAIPQRVVAVSDFIDLDYLLALDAPPVTYGFTNAWNSGAMPWQGAAADIPSFDASVEPQLEKIIEAQPDLIVAMQSVEDIYDQLSTIAPTIVLGWDTEIRSGLRLVAAALGRDDQAEARLAEVDTLVAAGRDTLTPYAGRALMVGFQYADTLYIWGPEAAGSKLFLDLGLNFVGSEDPFLTAASLEQWHLLDDAEILLSIASDPDGLAQQEASPLFRGLPAVQAGGYGVLSVILARSLGDGLSPLSLPWGLPHFIELIGQLANGQGTVLE